MAATNGLLAGAARAFFVFTFFSSFLSSFFFSPVGKCNEWIARIEKKEVTHWPWKRGYMRYCLFSWYIKYEILHSPQEVKVAH